MPPGEHRHLSSEVCPSERGTPASSLQQNYCLAADDVASPLSVAIMDKQAPAQGKTVTFSAQPHVSLIQGCSKHRRPLNMEKILWESFTDGQITEAILEEAAKLFSKNYGIWGKDSGRQGQ